MKDFIEIKGASEHNLKNIDVEIPKNKLVVFSGVSGSGKSSLAMDTLYAEGQRRYVESLSTYARQFLGILPRPEVESIEGLSPAIAIDQHGLSHNPRSTVGTVTEIYDYLRLLFAKIGHPHCPTCGREVAKQTSQQITEQIFDLAGEKINLESIIQLRFLILSPVVKDKRGEFGKLFENLRRKGFEQIRIDGRIFDLTEDLFLIKTNRHNIEVVIDRVAVDRKIIKQKTLWQRVKDDVEIALEMADGLVITSLVKDAGFAFPAKPKQMVDTLYSSKFACPKCNLSLPEIEPRLFSFNSPFGACPNCNGLGEKLRIDPSRVPTWRQAELERRYYTTTSDVVRQEIEKLMVREVCRVCQGTRLKKEALTVTIEKFSIADVSQWDLAKLFQWSLDLSQKLSSLKEKEIAKPVLSQVISRLKFLISVGVEYLVLHRRSSSLSVGEGQRIRLASQVGSGLTGVLYVLDEPTVGLHQRDVQKLIKTLQELRDLGNTLVVVEHDAEVLESADWIIDFGPLAGKDGGQVVASGTPETIKKSPASLTGQYLSGKKKIAVFPKSDRPTAGWLELRGCQVNNLKEVNLKIPLGKLICVCGVSGSGKSSLIIDTLYPALKKQFYPNWQELVGPFRSLTGTETLEQVLMVDQSPVGRTSRSNPATYIGIFDQARDLFAMVKEARLRGFSATYFSFNTEKGRCEACEGQGQLRVSMQFLPDLWIECEQCRGRRFSDEVLEVEYKGLNIAQVLSLTVKEGLEFFAPIPKIVSRLKVLNEIGLGYLELGQPSPTLSGGESQRLKLARELVKKSEGKTLYLLDEPTTGLHFADLKNLILVLRALVGRGDTVVVIEHNLEIIKQADWVVELGPEGGQAGGKIIASGGPMNLIQNPHSWTGKYLKKVI